MPTVYPLITEKQTFFDANSNELGGGKLFVYQANTTTKVTSYAETDGVSANSNPIVLNSRGEVPNGLYVAGGIQYKLVLAPSTDTDPPTSPIWTRDDLDPIGYVSPNAVSEWQSSGSTATQTSTTTFTVVGDQRTTFQVGRRVRATITAAPQRSYGTVSAATFSTGITTVTLSPVSTSLDAGLTGTTPDVGLLQATNPSVPWFMTIGFTSIIVNSTATLAAVTASGTIIQTASTDGDFVVHTSSAAAAEAAMRLTASDATSGVSLKLSNSSLNKQASIRGRSDGGVTIYVNQTSGGGSTSGTQAADIDASGFLNAVRVTENSTRVFSRNSSSLCGGPQNYDAANKVFTFPHGLGQLPTGWQVWAVCLDGTGNTGGANYPVGQCVAITNNQSSSMCSVTFDTTNVYVRVANNIAVVDFTTPSAIVALVAGTKWSLNVRAWY